LHDLRVSTLTIRALEQPLWLCFEPWATEYTVPLGRTAVVRFPRDIAIEVNHHADGITFMTSGCHPDVYSETGDPLLVYSDTMPETPADMMEKFRVIMAAVPPVRTQQAVKSPGHWVTRTVRQVWRRR
jgi:hypothetical protein